MQISPGELSMSELFSRSTQPEIWVTQVFAVVFATVVVNFLLMRVLDLLDRQIVKTETLWDDALLEAARLPIRLVSWMVGLSFAVMILRGVTDAAIFDYMPQARRVAIIVIIAMFLTRFISYVEKNVIDPARMNKPMDHSTAAALARLLRLSVVITSALIIMQTLGYSVSGVLAFGGIGGMAVGFAAKDLLANFFGGMIVYLDKPFRVGEWIRSPDRQIEGTVEDIGWRLTRIRTFDQRPLYVPNAMFNSIALENPSRMSNRRIYETMGVRYDDWRKLPAIIDDVRAMLQSHEHIDSSQTLIVNFTSYGDSCLEFFIYTFTRTTNWVEYHAIKQDVLLRVMTIVDSHGAEFAFPTRTVHMIPQQQQTPMEAVAEKQGISGHGE